MDTKVGIELGADSIKIVNNLDEDDAYIQKLSKIADMSKRIKEVSHCLSSYFSDYENLKSYYIIYDSFYDDYIWDITNSINEHYDKELEYDCCTKDNVCKDDCIHINIDHRTINIWNGSPSKYFFVGTNRLGSDRVVEEFRRVVTNHLLNELGVSPEIIDSTLLFSDSVITHMIESIDDNHYKIKFDGIQICCYFNHDYYKVIEEMLLNNRRDTKRVVVTGFKDSFPHIDEMLRSNDFEVESLKSSSCLFYYAMLALRRAI